VGFDQEETMASYPFEFNKERRVEQGVIFLSTKYNTRLIDERASNYPVSKDEIVFGQFTTPECIDIYEHDIALTYKQRSGIRSYNGRMEIFTSLAGMRLRKDIPFWDQVAYAGGITRTAYYYSKANTEPTHGLSIQTAGTITIRNVSSTTLQQGDLIRLRFPDPTMRTNGHGRLVIELDVFKPYTLYLEIREAATRFYNTTPTPSIGALNEQSSKPIRADWNGPISVLPIVMKQNQMASLFFGLSALVKMGIVSLNTDAYKGPEEMETSRKKLNGTLDSKSQKDLLLLASAMDLLPTSNHELMLPKPWIDDLCKAQLGGYLIDNPQKFSTLIGVLGGGPDYTEAKYLDKLQIESFKRLQEEHMNFFQYTQSQIIGRANDKAEPHGLFEIQLKGS
jgi:hypothetical protein